MAYVQDGTLWIKRLPDGAARALAAGNAVYGPRFSPSGRWILFHDGDDLLRLVSADGQRAKSWVGSGQWLCGREEVAVYLGEESNRTVVFGESDDWNTPRRTFFFSDPIGTMSADGSRRAWETSTGKGAQLFAGAFAGPGEPRLVAETEQGGFEVFAFARGGSRFLYWMTDEEGADVWSYGLDVYMAGGEQPIKTGIFTLVGDEANMLSLSPGADMLAAAVGNDKLTRQDHSIVLVNISDDSNLPVHRITGPEVSTIHPAWSPDGWQLAGLGSGAGSRPPAEADLVGGRCRTG